MRTGGDSCGRPTKPGRIGGGESSIRSGNRKSGEHKFETNESRRRGRGRRSRAKEERIEASSSSSPLSLSSSPLSLSLGSTLSSFVSDQRAKTTRGKMSTSNQAEMIVADSSRQSGEENNNNDNDHSFELPRRQLVRNLNDGQALEENCCSSRINNNNNNNTNNNNNNNNGSDNNSSKSQQADESLSQTSCWRMQQLVESGETKLMRHKQQLLLESGKGLQDSLELSTSSSSSCSFGQRPQNQQQQQPERRQSRPNALKLLKSPAFAQNSLAEEELERLADGGRRKSAGLATLTTTSAPNKTTTTTSEGPRDMTNRRRASCNEIAMQKRRQQTASFNWLQQSGRENENATEKESESERRKKTSAVNAANNAGCKAVSKLEEKEEVEEEDRDGPTPTNDLIRALIHKDRQALESIGGRGGTQMSYSSTSSSFSPPLPPISSSSTSLLAAKQSQIGGAQLEESAGRQIRMGLVDSTSGGDVCQDNDRATEIELTCYPHTLSNNWPTQIEAKMPTFGANNDNARQRQPHSGERTGEKRRSLGSQSEAATSLIGRRQSVGQSKSSQANVELEVRNKRQPFGAPQSGFMSSFAGRAGLVSEQAAYQCKPQQVAAAAAARRHSTYLAPSTLNEQMSTNCQLERTIRRGERRDEDDSGDNDTDQDVDADQDRDEPEQEEEEDYEFSEGPQSEDERECEALIARLSGLQTGQAGQVASMAASGSQVKQLSLYGGLPNSASSPSALGTPTNNDRGCGGPCCNHQLISESERDVKSGIKRRLEQQQVPVANVRAQAGGSISRLEGQQKAHRKVSLGAPDRMLETAYNQRTRRIGSNPLDRLNRLALEQVAASRQQQLVSQLQLASNRRVGKQGCAPASCPKGNAGKRHSIVELFSNGHSSNLANRLSHPRSLFSSSSSNGGSNSRLNQSNGSERQSKRQRASIGCAMDSERPYQSRLLGLNHHRPAATNQHHLSAAQYDPLIPESGFKIVVMGTSGSGKTSIIQRFMYDSFDRRHFPTVEDTYFIEFPYMKNTINISISDTSGTYQFPAMRKLAINSGDAFILVYSVDSQQSFDELEKLRQNILDEREQAYLETSASFTSGLGGCLTESRSSISTLSSGHHHCSPHQHGLHHHPAQQGSQGGQQTPQPPPPTPSNLDLPLATASSRAPDISPSRHWSLASLFGSHHNHGQHYQCQQQPPPTQQPNHCSATLSGSSLSSSICSSSCSSADNSRRSSVSAAEAALKTRRTRHPPMVIVANKHDLPIEQHQVNSDEIEALAVIDWNNGFVRTSAATNMNINEIFQQVLRQARQPPTLGEAILSKRRKSLPPKLPQTADHKH